MNKRFRITSYVRGSTSTSSLLIISTRNQIKLPQIIFYSFLIKLLKIHYYLASNLLFE
jgi:hypothetical protein